MVFSSRHSAYTSGDNKDVEDRDEFEPVKLDLFFLSCFQHLNQSSLTSCWTDVELDPLLSYANRSAAACFPPGATLVHRDPPMPEGSAGDDVPMSNGRAQIINFPGCPGVCGWLRNVELNTTCSKARRETGYAAKTWSCRLTLWLARCGESGGWEMPTIRAQGMLELHRIRSRCR